MKVYQVVNDEVLIDEAYSMFSGQEEAIKFTYKKIQDEDGCFWFVPVNNDYPAEQILFHNPKNKSSQGFGGATLDLPCEDGSIYPANGPWHTNSDALFAKTGIDIRDKHRTFGVIARKRDYQNHKPLFKGILYCDTNLVIGHFNRITQIAIEFATKLQHPVACYRASKEGSLSGYEYPLGKTYSDFTNWFENNR